MNSMNPSKESNESTAIVAKSVARIIASEGHGSRSSGTASLAIWLKDNGALGVRLAQNVDGIPGAQLPISQDLVQSLSSLFALRSKQGDTWQQLTMDVSLDDFGQVDFEIYFRQSPCDKYRQRSEK